MKFRYSKYYFESGLILKNKKIILFIVVLTLLFTYIIIDKTKVVVKDDNYELKIKASSIMKEAINAIRNEKIDRGFEIDTSSDINSTGMIGEEFTFITTTLGNIESKRTSINPNFGAVVVDMFLELGLKKGDIVAANFSSSFPAINIAVLSAMEAMELKGIVISSIGSSSYGGNITDFTYIDMEMFLHKKNILSNKSKAFSLGGADDVGKEMEEDTVLKILRRLENYDIDYINIDNIEENIKFRFNNYYNDKKIKAFVNVGGNLVSFGKGSSITYVNGGIITSIPNKTNDIGLAQMFLNNNIPVIHFLNIKDLAVKYGLPIDPVPIPKVGEGDIYYTYKYNKTIPILVLSFITLCVLFFKFK